MLTAVQAARNVITFKNGISACSMTPRLPGCAKMVKCYGRRLVADSTACDDTIGEWWSKLGDDVEGAEADLMASPAAFGVADSNIVAYGDRMWPHRQMNTELMWKKSNGSDVVVSIIDTGLHRALMEPTFKHGVLPGFDFVTDAILSGDQNGRDDDYSEPVQSPAACGAPQAWHGSQVAALVAAQDGSYRGTATDVKILPVRALGYCAQGHASDVADAIIWSAGLVVDGIHANPNKAKIAVLAFAGQGSCPSFLQSSITYAVEAGVVVLAAAGNDHADTNSYWPANCKGVLSVAASTADNDLALYSNLRAHVAAPGGDKKNPIITLAPGPAGTALVAHAAVGTSMAAAFAAGFLAISMDVYKDKFAIGNSVKPFVDKCPAARCGAGILSFYHEEVEIVLPTPEQPQQESYYKCSSSARMETVIRDVFPVMNTVYRYEKGGQPNELNVIVKVSLDRIEYFHEGVNYTDIVTDPGTSRGEDGEVEYFDPVTNETVRLSYWTYSFDSNTTEQYTKQEEMFPPDWDMEWNKPNLTDAFPYFDLALGAWSRKTVPCQGPIPPKARSAVLPPLPFTWTYRFDEQLTATEKASLVPVDPAGKTFIYVKTFINDNLRMLGGLSDPIYMAQHQKSFIIDIDRFHINLRGPAIDLPMINSFDEVGVIAFEWPLFLEVEVEYLTSIKAALRDNAATWPNEGTYHDSGYYQSSYFESNQDKRGNASPRQGWNNVPVDLQRADEIPFWSPKQDAPYWIGFYGTSHMHPGSIPRQTLATIRFVTDLTRQKQYTMYRIESDKDGPRTYKPWKVLSSSNINWSPASVNNIDTFSMIFMQSEDLYYGQWYPGWNGISADGVSMTWYPGGYYVNPDSYEIEATCSALPLTNILKKIPPVARYHAEDFNGTTWLDSSGNNKHSISILKSAGIEKVTELGAQNSATKPQTYVRGLFDSGISFPPNTIPYNFTVCATMNEWKQAGANFGYSYNWKMISARTGADKFDFAMSVYNSNPNRDNRPVVGWQVRCVRSGGGYYHSPSGTRLIANNGPWQLHLGDNTWEGWAAHWGVGTIYIWDRRLSDQDTLEVELWMKKSLHDFKINLKNVGACSNGLAVQDKCKFAPLANSQNVLHARFHASNWNAANQNLVDAGVKKFDSVEAGGTITKQTETGYGATVPVTSVSGDMFSFIKFPNGSIPDVFTICTVSRWMGSEYSFARARVVANFTYQAGGLVTNQEADVFFTDVSRIYNRGRIARARLGVKYVQSGTSKAPTGNEMDWYQGHSEKGLGTVAYGNARTKQIPLVPAPKTDWLVMCGKNKKPSTRTVLANGGDDMSLSGLSHEGFGDAALMINEKSNLIQDGSNIQCTTVDRTRTTCDPVPMTGQCCDEIGLLTLTANDMGDSSVVNGYKFNFRGALYNPTYSTAQEVAAGAKIIKAKSISNSALRGTLYLWDNGILLGTGTTEYNANHIYKKSATEPAPSADAVLFWRMEFTGYKVLDMASTHLSVCVIVQDQAMAQPKRVACFGKNPYGSLGSGTTARQVFYPDAIAQNTLDLGLAAGEEPEELFSGLTVMAVRTSLNRVKEWARPIDYGASGGLYGLAGQTTVAAAPFIQYDGVDVHAKKVAYGSVNMCLIRYEDDSLMCRGTDQYQSSYQAGVNITGHGGALKFPLRLLDFLQVTDVSLGDYHTCVIRKDNSKAYCFGLNGHGQTGSLTRWGQGASGHAYESWNPAFNFEVSEIGTGSVVTCAREKATGEVYCIGYYYQWTTQYTLNKMVEPVRCVDPYNDPARTSDPVGVCTATQRTFPMYNCSNVVTYQAQKCNDTQPPDNNASSWSLAHALVWGFHLTDTDMTTVVKQLHASLRDSSIDPTKIGECRSGYALPDRCAGIVSDSTCGPAAACPPGKQFDLVEGCVPCPLGTASNTWSLKNCPPCPAGSFADETGMTRCTKCGWHEYSDAEGATSSGTCTACPTGSFTEKKGVGSLEGCLSCPAS